MINLNNHFINIYIYYIYNDEIFDVDGIIVIH